MPQNKKKYRSTNLSKKKDTTSRIQKVAARKARKDGMMMKTKHPAAKQIKENLHKAMTKSIEDEMCARVGASAANTLKIVAGKIDKKNPQKKLKSST